MKRPVVYLLFCCLLFWACPPLPHHYVYLYKIEYKSVGRSGSEYIAIEKRTLTYVENGQDTIVKGLKNKHQKALHYYLKSTRLDSLGLLEVPSKKFQYDGAKATTLTITDLSPKEHTSVTFDHDNPPEEIKSFVAYIRKLANK